ncbi:uncharacterized protein LOC144116112 [Amblyomma americanum]
MYDRVSSGPLPRLTTICAHPMTSCSSLTSGQCRYSNGTLPTCSLQQRSLEDSLAVEAYCLTPFIQAARIEEASLGPWVSEAAGGVCSLIAVAVLQMKFRELETLSVALHLTAFVLLVDPRSSLDAILIDVATMHVIDLFPSGSTAKYPLLATLHFHPMTSCSSLTSGQCRYSNGTLPTCSLQQRSLEDCLAVEAYCLTPFIQASRIECVNKRFEL